MKNGIQLLYIIHVTEQTSKSNWYIPNGLKFNPSINVK